MFRIVVPVFFFASFPHAVVKVRERVPRRRQVAPLDSRWSFVLQTSLRKKKKTSIDPAF